MSLNNRGSMIFCIDISVFIERFIQPFFLCENLGVPHKDLRKNIKEENPVKRERFNDFYIISYEIILFRLLTYGRGLVNIDYYWSDDPYLTNKKKKKKKSNQKIKIKPKKERKKEKERKGNNAAKREESEKKTIHINHPHTHRCNKKKTISIRCKTKSSFKKNFSLLFLLGLSTPMRQLSVFFPLHLFLILRDTK